MSFAPALNWSAPGIALCLWLVPKITILLVIGLIAQRVLARWKALLAATAGNACLMGLLLLPLSALTSPTLTFNCLPAEKSGTPSRVDVRVATEPVVAEPIGTGDPFHSDGPIPVRAGTRSTPERESVSPPLAGALANAHAVSHAEAHSARSTTALTLNWLTLSFVGYAVVTVALLVRLLASLFAVSRLRARSTPVVDDAWRLDLERWSPRLGINCTIDLAWSNEVNVPLVLGWARPTVLLPSSFAGTESRNLPDAVLLHELAHVRRGDYSWNIVLRFVQAVYWLHPLVWLLGRDIAEMRERACDDLCIHELGGPSAYRDVLLAVAAGMSHHANPALGLAMARRSRLGARLKRIAESRGDARCLPPLPTRLSIAAAAAAAAIALGPIQLTRAEAPPLAPIAVAQEARAGKPAELRVGAGRVFHLQVVTADTRKPVPNADVRVRIALRQGDWRKTDADGRLDIVHSTGLSDRHFGVDVWGDGRAMQRHLWGNDPNKAIPDGATIPLQPGELLGGIVQDEQGRPIAGATIFLWSHNFKRKDSNELLYDLRAITRPDGRWRTTGAPETTGELLGFKVVHAEYLSSRHYGNTEIIPKIANLRADKAVTIMRKGVPIEGRVIDAEGKPVANASVLSMDGQDSLFNEVAPFAVLTDAQGHFRTGQVKPGEWFLVASAVGHGPGDQRVRIATAVPQVEITLGRPRVFKGRVVDTNGKPLAGAFVNPDVWKGYRCLGAFLWTDADGRFRWDDAPADALTVNVQQQGYVGLLRQIVPPAAEDVVFKLEPCLSVRGKVIDAETKKLVENATLEFGAVDPQTGDVARWTSPPRTGSATGVMLGSLSVNLPVTADAYKIRVQAPGYQTFVSRSIRREEKAVHDYVISLIPGVPKGPMATVLRADGKPLAGARVYSGQRNRHLSVNDGLVNERVGGRAILTDPDGRFPIPQQEQRYVVLILGDDVYAIASKKSLAESPVVRASSYGRIEGRYFVGNKPAGNQLLELSGQLQGESTTFSSVFFGERVTTGPLGGFSFERVIPMPHLRVGRRDRAETPGWVSSIGEAVHVTHGETTRVKIGGQGRAVIGRVEPPQGWKKPIDFTDQCGASVESNRSVVPVPLELLQGKRTLQESRWSEWSRAWRTSPEGLAYEDSRVGIAVGLAADGSFRIDDLPPGDFRLVVNINEQDWGRRTGPFTRALREFTIPPIPGGRTDEPLDLGLVRLAARSVLNAGDRAPPFAVTTTDGKALSLKDYQGKYLLLDFGVMWNDQSRLQVVRLNDVYHRFREGNRFAMLSLVMGPDNAATRSFVAEKGEPWPQAIVGALSNPIAAAFDVEDRQVPIAILIGPDGKVIAKDLRYTEKMIEAVQAALKRGEK